MKVFVYGTLKKGYGNNVLLNGTKFIEERTLKGYKLYDAGFPVAAPSEGNSIKGEVYELPENSPNLQWLDRLEGNGRMYNRTEHDDVELYVGHPQCWNFSRMTECPMDNNGIYYWSR